MKKLLIMLAIVLNSFLIIDKVNANSLIIEKNILDEDSDIISENWTQSYYYYYNQSSYKTKLDNIINQIKTTYKYYYIGINGMAFWNDDDIEMYVGAVNKNDINIVDNVFYNPNNAEIYEMNYFYYFYNKTIIYVTHTEDIFMPTYAKMFISMNKTNKSAVLAYNSSSNYVNHSYFSPSKYANINVKFNSNYLYQVYNSPDNYYEIINIAGVIYNTDDYIYTDSYKLNEEIDTSNLAYIRVDFDTTGSTYKDYHFSILENVSEKLKEVYFEKSHAWGVCVDADHCYDNYVNREYAEYTNDFNMYSYSSSFKYEDVDHGFYDETQELDYYYAYYDVSSISDIVTLNIDSTVPFEISYGYLENYTDTFITLNLKNYSGILLYPKANVYNGDYRFYLDNADINVIHYYNDLVTIYENINSNIYYINQLEYQDLQRYYLIKNNKISEDSYITFNTNYFSYQLVEKTTDNITIINPNTGKEEIINSIEDSENLYKISDVNSLLDRVSSFLTDMNKPMIAIIDLFKFGYDKLNSTFKTFLIVVLIIILVASLIFKARGD